MSDFLIFTRFDLRERCQSGMLYPVANLLILSSKLTPVRLVLPRCRFVLVPERALNGGKLGDLE